MFCLLAVGCFNGSAFAAPPPAENGKEDKAVIKSTLYLAGWDCTIAESQSNTVTITGFSEATQKVDKIWTKIYLQRWNGSQWVDVSSGYYQEKQNSSYVSASRSYNVTAGYYYRTRSEHQCIKGGVADPSNAVECISKSIYISE